MRSGYTEKTMFGKKVAIKFGTNAFDMLCEMHGYDDMSGIDKVMAKAAGIRDLIFCAAKAASLSNGKELKLNKYQIGDWLDDAPQSDYDDILKAIESTKILGAGVEVKEESK